MNELLYTAQDLAIILIGMDLDCRIESAVMDRIWNWEKEFLAEPYRQDRRKFTLEVLYWRHYFSEKTTLDRELPVVQKDLESGGHTVDLEEYRSDYFDPQSVLQKCPNPLPVWDGEGVCAYQAADPFGCVWIPPAFPSTDPPYAAVYGVLSPEGDTPGRDRL